MNNQIIKSERCGELMKSLTQVRQELGHLDKSATNPHFKSSYVQLPELLEKAVPVMAEHGIGFMQMVSGLAGVTTLIEHYESGQFMQCTSWIDPGKAGAHAAMGAVTYQKRYQLCAILAIPEEDDDGNSATPPKTTPLTNNQPTNGLPF